jgi:hypothetical protein
MPSCRCHRTGTNAAVNLGASLCVCFKPRVWSASTKPNQPTSWIPNTSAHYLVLQRCFAAIFESYSYYSPPPLRPLLPLFDSTLTQSGSILQYWGHTSSAALIRPQHLLCHLVSSTWEHVVFRRRNVCVIACNEIIEKYIILLNAFVTLKHILMFWLLYVSTSHRMTWIMFVPIKIDIK